MIKRLLSLFLILSGLFGVWGCASKPISNREEAPPIPQNGQSETSPIEQTDSNYIVRTDWMTFFFSKNDFQEADIMDIAGEAVLLMADIRSYLGVNYGLEEDEGTVCYFDSAYRDGNGQKRSMCFWDEKKMFCISPDAFVHEYVHMVSETHADLVYHPNALFSEGLAEYVSLHFLDEIASQPYTHFGQSEIATSSNASDHEAICTLLEKKNLPFFAKNYNKAVVAVADRYYGISHIDTKGDFYKYYVGYVFVDYCINHMGGINVFMAVYSDCVTAEDVYGKPADKLAMDACAFNTSFFYDGE